MPCIRVQGFFLLLFLAHYTTALAYSAVVWVLATFNSRVKNVVMFWQLPFKMYDFRTFLAIN
jgi:hypothetical protein